MSNAASPGIIFTVGKVAREASHAPTMVLSLLRSLQLLHPSLFPLL